MRICLEDNQATGGYTGARGKSQAISTWLQGAAQLPLTIPLVPISIINGSYSFNRYPLLFNFQIF